MKKLRLPESPGFNLFAGLFCLLLLLLLIVFVARGKAQSISTDIARKTNLTLNEGGLGGVVAKVDGRDVVLSGQTTQDATRIQAADAIARVAGVRNIANRIEVNRGARVRPPITSGRDRPAAPILRPGASQTPPRLGASSRPSPQPSAAPSTRPVAKPSVRPAPRPVAPKPATPSPVTPKPTPVRPVPVRPVPTRPTPVRPAPVRPVAPTRVTPTTVTPGRVVPKPAPRSNEGSSPVVTPVRPIPVAVRPVVAKPVAPVKVAPVTQPVPVVSSRLTVAGTPPKPYLLQLKVDERHTEATGFLPSDAALTELESRLTLKQPIRLKQADAPALFVEATRFAAEAAKRLSRGTVRIADRQIRIEGWADGEVNAFITELEEFLPAGYAFSVQVNSSRAPKPKAVPAVASPVAQAEVIETATVIPVESATMEVVDNQKFVDEALSCQSDVDDIMRGRTIAFQFASDALERRSEGLLNDIARAMNRCPSAYLYVIGHTDSVGTQGRNQRLSLRRASSVRRYLISQGVYDDLVLAEGRGEQEPIFSNSTEDGRAGNRRIEFSVRSEPTL